MSSEPIAINPYAVLANEYYSPEHKTSRNFDLVTKKIIAPWSSQNWSGKIVELGAGRGRATEFLGVPSQILVQADQCEEMLMIEPRESCFLQIKCDARSTPFLNNSFNHAIAFLFDPFNDRAFYREVYRLLLKGGSFIGTLPNYTWGTFLRQSLGLPLDQTRFLTKNGKVIFAPSLLSSNDELTRELTEVGFCDIEIIEGALPSDTDVVSKDVVIAAREAGLSLESIPIVQAFRAKK